MIQPGVGNVFWLVVGNDGDVEGSDGLDGSGAERPEDASLVTCPLPQDLGERCDGPALARASAPSAD